MTPTAAVPVAVVAAVLAILLLIPEPPARELHRLRIRAAPRPQRTHRLGWFLLAVPPVTAGLIGDGSAVVVVLVAELVAVTAGWLLVGWRRARGADRAADEVAHGCQILAGQLRVGLVPSAGLDVAAEDCPVLRDGAGAQRLGGDVTRTWRDAATRPGHDGLAALARVWQVCQVTGAPMADGLERVAAALARERRVAGMLASELAGPRATARLLAVLPIVGVGLGVGLGGDPGGFLLHHPLGWACLVAGVALACAGLVWVERIATEGQLSTPRRASTEGQG